jgi:tight adherence protein C
MLVLIFVLVFTAIALCSLYVLRPRENVVVRRLGGAAPVFDTRQRQLEVSAGRRLLLPVVQRVGRTLSSVLPHNFVKRINHMLIEADQPWSLGGFLTTWLVVGTVAIAFWLYACLAKDVTLFQAVGMGITIVPFGVGAPYLLLRKKVKARQKAIMLALPNALDLLVTCVEAGISVDSAFALVTEKMEGPISETFALYLRQIGLGRPRREALNYIADRSGLPDLIDLAAAVNQSEDLGTTMGDVLRLQADELRAARRERAQTAAQRAPVLMTIPLSLCFLPAMGAIVVVPSILNFIHFFGTMNK